MFDCFKGKSQAQRSLEFISLVEFRNASTEKFANNLISARYGDQKDFWLMCTKAFSISAATAVGVGSGIGISLALITAMSSVAGGVILGVAISSVIAFVAYNLIKGCVDQVGAKIAGDSASKSPLDRAGNFVEHHLNRTEQAVRDLFK
jgi:hypothetical protein